MSRSLARRIGARIAPGLTVLDVVDETPGRHPVYVVWNAAAWCPMACKLFDSPRKAEREGRIIEALSHPNVVRAYGFGEPGYLLTEFLEGPSLGRLLAEAPQGRLPLAEAIRVAMHLGAALAHVHGRGFVHLDVKPGNVIIARGRPVLFDFGWARALGAPRPPLVAGTDPYIAPEECRLGEATPAADVFSLGVVLYEALAGALPFGEPTRRTPFPQLGTAPAPLRRHRPRIASGLEALVTACLDGQASGRPTLPELLGGLHEFIDSGPRMWPEGFVPGMPSPAADIPSEALAA